MNRGQRSSSLHYAACFGRPDVAKVSPWMVPISLCFGAQVVGWECDTCACRYIVSWVCVGMLL